MAFVAENRKQYRGRAHHWLRSNPAAAAVGLVPDALGADKAARKSAEAGLSFLERVGLGDVVLAEAARYGPKAAAAIAALLDKDPLALDLKPPKAPAFLRVSELPSVLLRAGGRLPDEGIDALLEMLRTVPLSPRYPGVDAVAEAVEADSLDAFLAALVDQWVLAGGGGRHDWMVFAQGLFEAPAAQRRVGEQLRTWGSKNKANAERLADALALRPTDAALLHLAHVGQTSRFDALRGKIQGLLADIAESRGLTQAELEDRTGPDLGLDAGGVLALSYGDRGFSVGLDETLNLVIRDDEGSILKRLPPKRGTDDAALAKAARTRFAVFKKDVAAIAVRLQRRLEGAMVRQRAWSADAFGRFVVGHPVVCHMARGLVWEVIDGARFRVAEDGTLADVEDDPFALPDDAEVRIAHPLGLGAERAVWSERFADYDRVQPFEQLSRATFAPTDAERAQTIFDRHAGAVLPGAKLMGLLESRGWRRDGGGNVSGWSRSLQTEQGERVVRVPISPGFEIGFLADSGDQRVGPVDVGVPLGSVDPVAFSELARDLEAVRERG